MDPVPAFLAGLRSRSTIPRLCLEFLVLTAARSGEAQLAMWSEVDLDRKVWTLGPARMKSGIAQVWFNQANDLGRSFGDKTRGWEMDTIVRLSKADPDNEDDTGIRLEFEKARLRIPANWEQFKPLVIRPGEEWKVEKAPPKSKGAKGENAAPQFRAAYEHLAEAVKPVGGFDGAVVRKVKITEIREEMRSRGFLEDSPGQVCVTSPAVALAKATRAGGPLQATVYSNEFSVRADRVEALPHQFGSTRSEANTTSPIEAAGSTVRSWDDAEVGSCYVTTMAPRS